MHATGFHLNGFCPDQVCLLWGNSIFTCLIANFSCRKMRSSKHLATVLNYSYRHWELFRTWPDLKECLKAPEWNDPVTLASPISSKAPSFELSHQKILEMSFVRVPSLFFFYKNFLPAIHPAELYNYSQSLTHYGDDGSCRSNVKSIDLEQRVHLRELSHGLCSLFPQGWSTFQLLVSF